MRDKRRRRFPGRPRRPRHEALEFGRLVEIEIAKGKWGVEAAMDVVRRREGWGGRSKAYELWGIYQTHKAAQEEYERQYAQMQAEEGAKLAADPKLARRVGRLLVRIAREDELHRAQMNYRTTMRLSGSKEARRQWRAFRWRVFKRSVAFHWADLKMWVRRFRRR